jgi:hypothetical protein
MRRLARDLRHLALWLVGEAELFPYADWERDGRR